MKIGKYKLIREKDYYRIDGFSYIRMVLYGGKKTNLKFASFFSNMPRRIDPEWDIVWYFKDENTGWEYGDAISVLDRDLNENKLEEILENLRLSMGSLDILKEHYAPKQYNGILSKFDRSYKEGK